VIDRRRLVAYFAGSGVVGTGFVQALWAQAQQAPESAVTGAMIEAAAEIAGLEFDATEREMMRAGLARNQASFAALRALGIGNEVSPALLFEPDLPGVRAPVADGDERLTPTQWPDLQRPSDDDLAFASVSKLSHLLGTRQVSAAELTELYLDRLQRYDPRLLFQVTPTAERARRAAEVADREIGAGNRRGPLHGIPWGAKDLFAVDGYPTSWGAAPYRDQKLEGDATVVQRLDDAGAVLVAKLTLGALAMGDVWFGGRTRNPWNTEQGSSGSSAGPGSATAAGCVGFAIGTETRGSIVSPSTRNGVTGFRPTFGRVSRHGAMALSWSMDKIGPMCRSAEDCALVFAAIHGADGLDPSARTRPFVWDANRDVRDLRVGFLERAFEAGERYSNRDFDLETLRVLREDLGIDLQAVDLPDFPVDAMSFILTAEAAAAFDDLTRSGRDDELTRQGSGAWPNTFRSARMIPAVEYIQANRARAIYQVQLADALRDVDVVVAPSYRLGILGATNLTGQPCVAVPNGFQEDGTPVGISFIGNLYQDAEALQVAHAYQQATDFHLRRPALA
jgi:Asp-tRNA(Asn)/Glu-tRNA(Gln) amidotransferase A subunit family amidase